MLNNMQSVIGVYEAENGHGFRFHKVEPMLGERVAHGQPIAQIGTIKNSPGCMLDRKCPCVICMKLLKNEWLELCGKQYVNAWNLTC